MVWHDLTICFLRCLAHDDRIWCPKPGRFSNVSGSTMMQRHRGCEDLLSTLFFFLSLYIRTSLYTYNIHIYIYTFTYAYVHFPLYPYTQLIYIACIIFPSSSYNMDSSDSQVFGAPVQNRPQQRPRPAKYQAGTEVEEGARRHKIWVGGVRRRGGAIAPSSWWDDSLYHTMPEML